jgi:transcriptional regulator with XRE-family HTH domain
MSTVAVGSYIRTLREGRKLTRETVAERVGTSISQLVRIESGEQETRGTLLFAVLSAVQGDPRDIADLLLLEGATANDGVRFAQAALQSPDTSTQIKSSADVAELMRYLEEEMKAIREEDRPSLLGVIRGIFVGFRVGRQRSDDSRA